MSATVKGAPQPKTPSDQSERRPESAWTSFLRVQNLALVLPLGVVSGLAQLLGGAVFVATCGATLSELAILYVVYAFKLLPNRRTALTAIGVLGAVILFALLLGAKALTNRAVAPTSGQSIPGLPPSENRPTQGFSLDDLYRELDGSGEASHLRALAELDRRLLFAQADIRHAILDHLAVFVTQHDPPRPVDPYGYCLDTLPPSYPADVLTAVRVIGRHPETDNGFAVDLSNTNLAFASLQGPDLNFHGVIFDGALMCRTFLAARFDGASFDGSDMRFIIMPKSSGLTVKQLLAARTLFKTILPSRLASDPALRRAIAKDPAA